MSSWVSRETIAKAKAAARALRAAPYHRLRWENREAWLGWLTEAERRLAAAQRAIIEESRR